MTRFLSKQVFMRGAKLFVLALLVAAYAGSASATSITYVFTGTASGTLGDETPFSGVLLTVTASGNTDDVTLSGTTYTDKLLTTTITIAGIGTMTVTPGAEQYDYVFDNQTDQKIGYGVTGIPFCCDIIQFVSAAYASYDLKSSIGPLPYSTDLSISDWIDVPTSMGNLTLSSYTSNTFAATLTSTSQTQTLGPPGTTTTFTFNTDTYKVTGVNNSGGEVLTVEAVLVPQSQFPILVNFPNETCVPYGDYSAALGQDTCVEFHVECTGQLDCTTGFTYLVATGYDLPTSLSGGIGGPDFLVRHGGSCPLLSADNVQSIFLSYNADVKDPTTKGGSGTPSCFVATYTNTPGTPLITSGTTSRFVGFESPVVNTDLNVVQAGATRPLKWQWFDIAGNPVTNLTWCASPNPAPGSCTAPWVNLQYYGISCATDASLNTGTTDVSGQGSSGLQNLGGGNYQFNWKTQKGWANTCSTVQVTFDSGLVYVPAVGFKFK